MNTDLTPAQCEEILAANHYAHLGCVDDGEPYVVPITYLYHDGFLYGFSKEGHKLDILRSNPSMCIQVEHVITGVEWGSVMCWGNFEEITDANLKQNIIALFADQHGRILMDEKKTPISPMIKAALQRRTDEIGTGVIYRMKPTRMTGKAEKAK